MRILVLHFFLVTLLTACADDTGSRPESVKAGTEIVDSASAMSSVLLDALTALQKHIRGESVLDDAAVEALTKVVGENKSALMSSTAAIRAAQDLVSVFDAKVGPLWVKHPPLNQKQKLPGDVTRWAVFWVMQHLMDELYNTEGMQNHRDLLDGFRFGSADHFPGRVEATLDPTAVYRVKINGSYPDTWGSPVMHMERPARKPTGAYLVPGTIATVTVPESLVGKGYQILVGAHSWDHSNKPKVLRLYRVTALYDIDRTEVKVANPFGGGLYIEVPARADAGVVEVDVRNAVRSPYFSWKPFHRSTLEEWQKVERLHKAPWADFQSEMYMMQVPTCWIYALDDPVTLMENWDKALGVCNALMGRPHRFGREVLYNQVDLQMRGKAFHPGYPAGNRGYDPMDETDGYSRNHLVRGPQYAHNYEFHELGHAFLFPKYVGDQESAVNLPHVAVMHQAFGAELNEAFRGSRLAGEEPFKTLDTSAIEWMMSDSFVDDGFMKAAERAYQLKGHAKYVDIARLFGWDALGKFFASTQQDHMDGKPWPRNSTGEEGDAYTLRLSESVGADLRPLIHFWGIPIVNPQASDAAFRAAGLNPSTRIHELLVHYKGLIPADNAAFRDYAFKWWGKEPRTDGFTTERNHAARWATYDEAQAAKAGKVLQAIIDRYFPVKK